MSKVYLDKVLAIAEAEVGYLEKASNSQLDNKTANAGSNNWTKYARDLYAAGYYNGNKNGYAWCDVFVDWLFYMASGKDATHAQEVECQTGEYGAGCTFSSRYYEYQGRFYKSNPKIGDQIFFGTDKNNITHTGIVYKVDANRVYTIEGNTSAGNDVVIPNGGAVARKSYSLSSANIFGYGRPKYDGESAPKSNSVSMPVPPFTDVAANKFYTEDVKWARDNGITLGTSPTTFSPDKPVTRGEMSVFLHRLYELLKK